ncbi:MAG: ABC transporter ATP-binding protein [Clostridiaceae bacterium]|nr:ABC transporter ATP-binding protein [Clostridiaceae bacterium]
MVKVTNLTKTYGDFTAVDNISFEIRKGEIFGFLGPNGAGKTSTINMMIGLSRSTTGEITVGGIDVKKQIKRARAIMGIVPDESNLYNEMDGFENLCFCAALYGMRKNEREAKARLLLERFGLKGAGKRPFKAYSKGMRRKLTIAAALIHSPQVLFLDEPTTGIDVESSRQIREMIVGLKQQGVTIFLTTHYIEEAERLCDRVAFIADGQIVASGTVPELMGSVAHEHTIRFVTDRNAADLATELVAELQAGFAGSKVEVRPDQSLVMVSERRIPLLPVMEFFHDRGINVYEARELRPSLEDVFVELTGIDSSVLKKDKEKGGRR